MCDLAIWRFRWFFSQFCISSVCDIRSPMVYHQMVNEPASWIEDITSYMKGILSAKIWPIVQSVDISAEEFCSAVASAHAAYPDGVLVFSCAGMDSEKWNCLLDGSPKE